MGNKKTEKKDEGNWLDSFPDAIFYQAIDELEQNPEKAVELLMKSAQKEYDPAIYMLGLCYLEGTGTAQNKKEGMRLLKKAAELGNADSQLDYGKLLDENGLSEEGRAWILKSAENNNKNAQLIVGSWYMDGDGVEKDPEKAAEWLRKSAENDNPYGMFLYGAILGSDDLPLYNPDLAREWLLKALNNGVEEAKEILDELEAQINQESEYQLSWWSLTEFGFDNEPLKTLNVQFDAFDGIHAQNAINVFLNGEDLKLLKNQEKGREFIRKFYDRYILPEPGISLKKIEEEKEE